MAATGDVRARTAVGSRSGNVSKKVSFLLDEAEPRRRAQPTGMILCLRDRSEHDIRSDSVIG